MLAATADTDLSHGAFRLERVLRQVRTHTDGRGRQLRRVGQGWLAARCGHRSKRTIRRYLAELERAGRVVRRPQRRRRVDGRWYSIECQSYELRNPDRNGKTPGHSGRTSMSGPPFGGVAGAPSGAPQRLSNPVEHGHCGHGYPRPEVCPLCRRGIAPYDD